MKSKLFRFISILSSVTLLSCAQQEIYNQNYDFNAASSSVNSDLLLLNSVRASKRRPMQFSKMQTYEGAGGTTLTIGGRTSFGPGIVNPTRSFEPNLVAKSPVTKIALVDLNTQEAQASLRRLLTMNEYRYHWLMSGAFRQDLIDTLMIEQIRVSEDIFKQLHSRAIQKCRIDCTSSAAYNEYIKQCGGDLTKIGTLIPIFYPDKPKLIKKKPPPYRSSYLPPENITTLQGGHSNILRHSVRVVTNTVATECSFLAFRAFIEMLDMSDLVIYFKKKSQTPDNPKDVDKNYHDRHVNIQISNTNSSDQTKKEADSKPTHVVSFANENIMRILGGKCKSAEETGIMCFEYVLRSPERIVRYLGEIIAVQNASVKNFSPYLFADSHHRFEIFKVTKGPSMGDKSALSVTDEDGESFHVPSAVVDDPSHHRSLETMSLAADIVNSAVSAKDLPTVNSITLSSPQ